MSPCVAHRGGSASGRSPWWFLVPTIFEAIGGSIARTEGAAIGFGVGVIWFVGVMVGLARTRVVASGSHVQVRNLYRTHEVERPARLVTRPVRWGHKSFDARCVERPGRAPLKIWATFAGDNYVEVEKVFQHRK